MVGSIQEVREGVYRLVVSTGWDSIAKRYGQKTRRFKGTRRQAERELARLVAEVDAGSVNIRAMTVSQLLDRYLEHAAIEPDTLKDYTGIARLYLRPALGAKRLDKLAAADLDAMYDSLTVGAARVAKVHTVVRSALAQAVRWKLISENVATDATPPSVARVQLNIPTKAVVRRLLRGSHGDLNLFIKLAVATGARPGELCALRWSDFNIKKRTVTIARALAPDGRRIKGTKTDEARTLSLSAKLVVDLQPGKGYVFGGEIPWRRDRATKLFADLRDTLKVDHRLYDLRHFHATELLDAGVSPVVVAHRLGHRNVSTTVNLYGHLRPESDRLASGKLDDLLG